MEIKMDDHHRQRINLQASLAAISYDIRTKSERVARMGGDRKFRVVVDLERIIARARSHRLFLLGMLRQLEAA